ncbi:hypothetical protein [Dactylosporangium sp. CS-033363]|uniref:hypothetical protein n=1 Tax=Dactylosporangium sp. CS-033363 TaxID=3239935 RepID=UPI003D93F83C
MQSHVRGQARPGRLQANRQLAPDQRTGRPEPVVERDERLVEVADGHRGHPGVGQQDTHGE